jgi:hypothetical protein
MKTSFKLYEGNKADLPSELTEGQVYFIKDEGNIYIDLKVNGERKRIDLSESAKDYTDQAVETASANQSFNGRTGAVQPVEGDYTAKMVGAIPAGEKGAPSGVASLGIDGQLAGTQVPNYLDAQVAWLAIMSNNLLEIEKRSIKDKIDIWYKTPYAWTKDMVRKATELGILTSQEYHDVTGEAYAVEEGGSE